MRINPSDIPSIGLSPEKTQKKDGTSTFIDTLKEAIDSTNKSIKESEKAALELANGKSGNIHETMIAMQKADISLRLMIAVTNQLTDGYRELMRLR